MSVAIDTKYLLMIKGQLEHFKRINTDLYNFRCPFCGDSKKDTKKARGYIFVHQNNLVYKCHNCGVSGCFGYLLKRVDPQLYQRYRIENIRHNKFENDVVVENPLESLRSTRNIIPKNEMIFEGLTRLDRLDKNHYCYQYVKQRMIPTSMYPFLYFCDNFRQFIHKINPDQYKQTNIIESRLIIPYYDKDGTCFAFQGRSLDNKSHLRYLTIKLDQTKSNVYGLDRVKFDRKIFVTEGPIDSMFLPNALAVSGASYQCDLIQSIKNTLTIVPDNERRNKAVCDQIGKMVDSGFSVCLWPDNLNFKDINDAILQGYTRQDLVEIINNNTYKGLVGKVKFRTWVQC